MTITTPSKELHVIPPLYKTLFQPIKDEHTHGGEAGPGRWVATIGPGQCGIHPATKGTLEKEKNTRQIQEIKTHTRKGSFIFPKVKGLVF